MENTEIVFQCEDEKFPKILELLLLVPKNLEKNIKNIKWYTPIQEDKLIIC